MLIISWNVAGLSTTLQRINRDYKTFTHFLNRHGNPDILCIQEHKIPLTQLSSRSEPYNCSTSLPGYESFWSCCTDPSKKGFNGVVTYVKSGLTTNAINTPFDNHELDCQGRCVMTDHGKFVVFNVYVPAAGANPFEYKMQFLNKLRECMRVQREEKGKKVVLVGDLNICHGGYDEHWKYRSIHVDAIVNEIKQVHKSDTHTTRIDTSMSSTSSSSSTCNVPKWKLDLYQHWDTIQKTLSTIKAIPITTKNMSTGSTSNKFRAQVTLNNGEGRNVTLGKAEATEEECIYNFSFPQRTYYDYELETDVVARKANVVPLTILYELMSKIAKIDWGTSVLNMIANTDYALRKTSPHSKWLSRVVDEDDMIDTFRSLYPSAQGRFTCWDQRTNGRFENIGVRLDYIIIDKSISQHIHRDKRKLRCCNYPTNKDFNTEEAAFHAATASGKFQGASFDGGGIVESSQNILDSQFGEDHTGIIYTPPSYSDHVAVSLLLDEDWDRQYCQNNTLVLNGKCPKTKKTQPHKAQMSISSFFGKTTTSNDGIVSSTNSSSGSNNVSSNKSKASNEQSEKFTSKNKRGNSTTSYISGVKRKKSSDGSRKKSSSLQNKKGTIHNFFKK